MVDCVIGGSPCQNLSIAGDRKGLLGSESCLFSEQIRIIREMREESNGKYPRYMVWENVPNALNCNRGDDFATVLWETIKIADAKAPCIEVPASGWPSWGGYRDGMAERWSLAWRVLDAQHFGVPQRRRRIALVADFGGDTAGEILFERKGLPWNHGTSKEEREIVAGETKDSTCCTILDMTHACDVIRNCGTVCPTLQSRMGTGGNQVPLVFEIQTSAQNKENSKAKIKNSIRRLTPLECERLQGFPDNWTDIGSWTDTKGKLHKYSSDTARYKALGNSIAIPPWMWVLRRLCENYNRPATMASLFDGIGGFPLIWEYINGKGSCIWASEIEEFPIAVTNKRFNLEEV